MNTDPQGQDKARRPALQLAVENLEKTIDRLRTRIVPLHERTCGPSPPATAENGLLCASYAERVDTLNKAVSDIEKLVGDITVQV